MRSVVNNIMSAVATVIRSIRSFSGFIDWRRILFLCICIAVWIVSNIPWYDRGRVKVGYVSSYVHGSDTDYYTYLAFIRESKDGAWTIPALYTTEPSQSTSIYGFYIVIGKVASLFGLTPVVAYHLSRIVCAFLFVFGLYDVAVACAGKVRGFLVAIVGLFSTTPIAHFLFLFESGIVKFYEIDRWWNNLDPLFRIDYVPHHQCAIALLFIVFAHYIRSVRSGSWGNIVLLAVLPFVIGYMYPPPGFVLLLASVLGSMWWIGMRKIQRKPYSMKPFFLACVMGCSILLSFALLHMETNKGFPWNQWSIWDVRIWNERPRFFLYLFLSGGLAWFVGLPMLASSIIIPRRLETIMLAVWGMLPFLLFPVFKYFHIAIIRLTYLATFVPYAYFAVLAIEMLVSRIPYVRMRLAIGWICLILFFVVSFPTTKYFYEQKYRNYSYDAPHIRVAKGVMDALDYAALHLRDHKVVLADQPVSLMLPAYASGISYWGHPVHTQSFEEKMYQFRSFFSGTMTQEIANTFIQKGNISYIFLGPEEKRFGGSLSKYRIPLSVWYENEDVTIYEIKKN